MRERPDLYTVSRLVREVRWLLLDAFPELLVEGEISNLARPRSGHLYFTLKDRESQIRCVMFGGQRQWEGGLTEGLSVVVAARVTLYEARGDLQLQVSSIRPVGAGRLQLELEQLKQQLAQEGLFEPSRKRPIPRWPARIGVVTSPTGAAIRDVLKVLRKRFPAIEVILYPCKVQGEEAPEEIVRALTIANRRRECDLLLLVRGGGSAEDLAAFNEEVVVRAVASSHLPVVTGIGHEIDWTLADLAADLRAPTPSAAAEQVSPDREALLSRLRQLKAQLKGGISRGLKRRRERLGLLSERLSRHHPSSLLLDLEQRLDELQLRLQRAMADHLEEGTRQLGALGQRLDDLSPLKTLKRGYVLVFGEDGRPVASARELRSGEEVVLRFADGSVRAVVRSDG